MRGEIYYMRRMKKALVTLAVMAMTASMFPTNAFATTPNRFAGVDRYQTASLIADEVGSPNKVAILTAGADANLVDALAAAPFASNEKAPILLTGGSKLDNFTQAELTKLAVNKVFITSGSGVITKGVTDKLTTLGISYEFLGGHDRYETALNIAKKLTNPTGVIVASANDANLVDSLSASSIAAANNMAIVLTDKDGMSATNKAYIKSLNVPIYVIGGNGVISDSVVTSLGATRVSGANRYATNVAVLNQFKAKVNFETAYVASGNDTHLVDALTGAMLAAKSNSAIILSDGATISSATADFIKTAGIKNVVAFGGTSSVPENVRTGIVSPVPIVAPPVSTGGGYTAPVVALNSIAITTPSTKLIYTVGDTLDISGLVVTGTYSDTSTQMEMVLPTDVTGFSSATPVIDQLLTITVGGKTATYTITVNAVPDTTAPVISNVSVSSNNADNTKAMNGDIITLTFTSDEPITQLSNFKINGSNPNTFTNVGNNYTATHLVDSGDTTGSAITFQINVKNTAGIYSQTIEQASDNSSVTIIPEYARISGVSISSSNTTSSTIATIGDTITLTFTTDEQVTKLSNFKINGSDPNTFIETANLDGTYTYTVTHIVDSGDPITNVPSTFQINVENTANIYTPTVEQTTDGSSVTIN